MAVGRVNVGGMASTSFFSIEDYHIKQVLDYDLEFQYDKYQNLSVDELGNIFINRKEGNAYFFSKISPKGNVLWDRAINLSNWLYVNIYYAKPYVYYSSDKKIYKIDEDDGTPIWELDLENELASLIKHMEVSDDYHVYIGIEGSRAEFLCLSPTNEILWRNSPMSDVSSLAVDNNDFGVIVSTGNSGGKYRKNGTVIWNAQADFRSATFLRYNKITDIIYLTSPISGQGIVTYSNTNGGKITSNIYKPQNIMFNNAGKAFAGVGQEISKLKSNTVEKEITVPITGLSLKKSALCKTKNTFHVVHGNKYKIYQLTIK